jgi:hypothetical protein
VALEEYENTIELLKAIPAPLKLVIPGNHDLSLDGNFWNSNSTEEGRTMHNKARTLWTDSIESSILLLDEGTNNFILDNGAKLSVYASPYTINSHGVNEWAFGYSSAKDRFNPEGEGITYGKVTGSERSILTGGGVDVIMTHGPPNYRLDVSSNSESLGCPHLFRALRRTRPKLHAFGHIHNAYGTDIVQWSKRRELPADDDVDDGIQRKFRVEGLAEGSVSRISIEGEDEKTLFLNAALMGSRGKLDNAPWLVDFELESA